jgi:hypothetical protein
MLQKLEAGASDFPFGGGGSEARREQNFKAFTADRMQKAGAPEGQLATPENLDNLHMALGNQFNELDVAAGSISARQPAHAVPGGAECR